MFLVNRHLARNRELRLTYAGTSDASPRNVLPFTRWCCLLCGFATDYFQCRQSHPRQNDRHLRFINGRVQQLHSGPHEKVEECALVGNTGHFDNDRLGQIRGLGRHESRQVRLQVNRFVFPAGLIPQSAFIARGRPGHTLCRASELAGGRGYASKNPGKSLPLFLRQRNTCALCWPSR